MFCSIGSNAATLCSAMVLAACLSPTTAAGHQDILPAVLDGTLVTTRSDFASGESIERVFLADLEKLSEVYETSSPGFMGMGRQELIPEGMSLLPALAPLSFSLPAMVMPDSSTARNLWYWSGDGEFSLSGPPNGVHLDVTLGTTRLTVADGTGHDVSGFVIGTTSSTGSLHKHIDFQLLGPGGQEPADGLYVLPMTLSMPGTTDSDPLVILFNKNVASSSVEEALTWMETRFVPEPATSLFFMISALVLGRRRAGTGSR